MVNVVMEKEEIVKSREGSTVSDDRETRPERSKSKIKDDKTRRYGGAGSVLVELATASCRGTTTVRVRGGRPLEAGWLLRPIAVEQRSLI